MSLGLGIYLGYVHTLNWVQRVVDTIHPIRENNFNYKFIFPLLGYDFADTKQFFENHALETKLNDYIQSQYQDKSAQSISVYFRNLTNINWAGINQDIQYHPGSILKVLIMIGYFREAELDPRILQRTFVYSKKTDQEANSLKFSSNTNLIVGQNYTVEYLIKDMISNSDNGAETLLVDNVDHTILNAAYSDLNISNPESVSGDYTISASQYGAFLRVLYNSTYLTEQYSEKALSIMSQSEYKDGIIAGLPAGVAVAQKYGERLDDSSNVAIVIELHNCGVVYAKSPYAICIMTKGNNINKLTAVIKNISSIVYEYVSHH